MSIEFDKRNYRKHGAKNKALIKKSLTELGAGRSILLDADDTIVAGNGVYEQASKLGLPVRVIETDGSELVAVKRTDVRSTDQKRALLAIVDNTTSDSSEMDIPLLQADFDAPTLEAWGVDLEGIEGQDMTEQAEATDDDWTDQEEEEAPTVCKEGDVWALGEHRLACGDSTNPETLQRLLQGQTADLWLTDPPLQR